jgi:gliding motility-associated lipoprotein GldH
MKYKSKIELFKEPIFFCSILFLILVFGYSCNKQNINELYYKFPDKTWARFNLLSFEIPIKNIEKPYDVYLFARFTPDYQYNILDFNMVMNTPAGEERIYEYQMKVKSNAGKYFIECDKDSCIGNILLKRDLYLSKAGILKIEIENLTPRLVTEGVIGVGIRMVESGK